MEVVVHRSCGLDVHRSKIVACLLIEEGARRPKKVVRTFTAMRSSLEELRDWLVAEKITHVSMEGTGVYWRPVYAMLEETVDVSLVNARDVKKLKRGHKTDVSDAEWLATLLRHGLLRKSFVPPPAIREIRDLARYRRMLVDTLTGEKNRLLKLLDSVGIKLGSVASDVFGKSGMAMLSAISKGDLNIEDTVQLARGSLRGKLAELRLALGVVLRDHHRMLLTDQLERVQRTMEDLKRYEAKLDECVAPYEETIRLLMTIPGVQRIAAIVLFSEVGPSVAAFPTAGHFASWTGTCPGLHESAGKTRAVGCRPGNKYTQAILFECALAAVRLKGSYLKEKYRRLKAARGGMRGIMAIAHKLAEAVWRTISTRTAHVDLGAEYLDRRRLQSTTKRLLDRLKALGVNRDAILAHLPPELPETSPVA